MTVVATTISRKLAHRMLLFGLFRPGESIMIASTSVGASRSAIILAFYRRSLDIKCIAFQHCFGIL